jgi:hypothetical protein
MDRPVGGMSVHLACTVIAIYILSGPEVCVRLRAPSRMD